MRTEDEDPEPKTTSGLWICPELTVSKKMKPSDISARNVPAVEINRKQILP